MSNHFTGLSLGPPLGDQRLDLCDLYAFTAPGDPGRTAIILNANPPADALHPDAVYRLNIDNDGDYLTDIAFSWVFSPPAADGSQTYSVFMATGEQARKPEPTGNKIVSDAAVSFGPQANVVTSGDYQVAAGSRSDAFFFDNDGITNLFDTSGKRNFTAPIWAGSPRGPASTPTSRPTSSPWPSKRRPQTWHPSPNCTSGAAAASGATASSSTPTAPDTHP
ncbi:DUF4331 family protein [Nonomuraea thailandensis]